MNRKDLISKIFAVSDFESYLEIGSRTGTSFLPIKARYKTAIDPVFMIHSRYKVRMLLKNPRNFFNKYFEETSDDFFAKRTDYLNKIGKVDVALVDGLHTFEGALKDVLNTLKYTNPNGVIIMHDCLPPNTAAAYPSKSFPTEEEQQQLEGWSGEWCGDVWKSIVYLKKMLSDVCDVYVINEDYGLGIVKPKGQFDKSRLKVDRTLLEEIDKMDYADMMQDPEGIINLKPVSVIQELIGQMKGKK